MCKLSPKNGDVRIFNFDVEHGSFLYQESAEASGRYGRREARKNSHRVVTSKVQMPDSGSVVR
jgi:hypothetical protein